MTTTTAKGAYQIEIFEGGQLVKDTGEFDNLITDLALEHGNPFYSGVLCIGRGTTPPTFSDVALEDEVAAKSASFASNSSVMILKNNKRYTKRSTTVSFTGLTGDIAEVGFRGSEANSVRSRTLIQDGNGLLTVLRIKPEQTIKITYYIYILIPDIIATGTVTTSYGSSNFTIKPHADLLTPRGIFAGSFHNPFDGVRLKAILTNGSVSADVFTWSYDTTTRTATGTVNFNAVDAGTRLITGFEANNSLPIIELSTPITNPSKHDISFTLTFTWGRE